MNIGGRPLNSWPAFIPATFELIILCAVLGGLAALFFTLRLPTVYHPVFNHPDFRRASRDGFFLCIESTGQTVRCAQDRLFPAHAGLRSPCKPSRNEPRPPSRHASFRPGASPLWHVPAAGGLRQPQKRHEDQAADESKFFADGQSSRQPPAHSIAQSDLRIDTLLYYAGRNPDGTPGHADAVAGQRRRARARPGAVHGDLRELPRRGRLRAGHHRAARFSFAAVLPRGAVASTPRWATCTT